MQRFIVSLSSKPDFQDFRGSELQAVADFFRFPIDFEDQDLEDDRRSFFSVLLPGEREARLLASRSILLKDIYEYWARGSTLEEAHQEIRQNAQLWERFVQDTPFKFLFTTHNATLTPEDMVNTVNSFKYLGFKGPVSMTNPQLELGVMEEYASAEKPHEGNIKLQERLFDVWVGRKLANGQRQLITTYDVKKRVHIGNTSMEAEASLIMANQALSSKGKIVYDPFAGTGSMLLTSAHWGAYVLGSDIDGRQMRGSKSGAVRGSKSGTKQGIQSAAEQYGTRSCLLDCMTFDLTHHPWRTEGFLDAVVTDPPYGVRAGAKKLGRKDPASLSSEPWKMANGKHSHEAPHYLPPSMPWELADLLVELLDFSHQMLRPGGRLVYWLPTVIETYQDTDVPQRAGMRLVANSCQPFNKWARRLITMEKVADDQSSDDPATRPQGPLPAHYQFREQYYSRFEREVAPSRS